MAAPKKTDPNAAPKKQARAKKAKAPKVDLDLHTSLLTKALLGKVLQASGATVQEDESSGGFVFSGELSPDLVLAGFMSIGQAAGMLAVLIQNGLPNVDLDVLVSNLEEAFEHGMESFEDTAVPVTTH